MASLQEKPGVPGAEVGHHENVSNREQDEIARIDAVATAPETTLASFAHLDEKKILRKVGFLLDF
jgi:hypothetical protein